MKDILELAERKHKALLRDIAIYKSLLYKIATPEHANIIRTYIDRPVKIPTNTTDSSTFLTNLIKDK